MKATIKYTDGKTVELEGTPQELQGVLVALLGPAPFQWTLQQPISIMTPFIVDTCVHEYPTTWMGVIPPSCKKCGMYQPSCVFTNVGSTNQNIDNLDSITYS